MDDKPFLPENLLVDRENFGGFHNPENQRIAKENGILPEDIYNIVEYWDKLDSSIREKLNPLSTYQIQLDQNDKILNWFRYWSKSRPQNINQLEKSILNGQINSKKIENDFKLDEIINQINKTQEVEKNLKIENLIFEIQAIIGALCIIVEMTSDTAITNQDMVIMQMGRLLNGVNLEGNDQWDLLYRLVNGEDIDLFPGEADVDFMSMMLLIFGPQIIGKNDFRLQFEITKLETDEPNAKLLEMTADRSIKIMNDPQKFIQNRFINKSITRTKNGEKTEIDLEQFLDEMLQLRVDKLTNIINTQSETKKPEPVLSKAA